MPEKSDGNLWGESRPVTVIGAPEEPKPEGAGVPSAATLAEMAAGRAVLAANAAGRRLKAEELVVEPEFEVQIPSPPRRGRPKKDTTPADLKTFDKEFMVGEPFIK